MGVVSDLIIPRQEAREMTTFEIHALIPHTYTNARGKRVLKGKQRAQHRRRRRLPGYLPFFSSSTVRKSGVFSVLCVLCLVFLAGSQLLCLNLRKKTRKY